MEGRILGAPTFASEALRSPTPINKDPNPGHPPAQRPQILGPLGFNGLNKRVLEP